MRKKLHTIMNTPDLPTDFTELEYLESNGRQWIDTGHIFTYQDEVSCVAELIKFDTWWVNLFGCWHESGANLFFCWENYGDTKMGIFGHGTGKTFQWDEEPTLKKMKIQLSPAGNLYINNILIDTNTSGKNRFPTKYPASLFTINNKGTGDWGGGTQRIFAFNIKRAGTYIFTLVPVLNADGTPCMYDKISQQCFPNQGTGTFGYKIKATGEVVAPKST